MQFYKYFFFLLLCCIAGPINAESIHSTSYSGQKSLIINSHTVHIPTLPLARDADIGNIYISWRLSEITDDSAVIYFGFTEGCTGENICAYASYSYFPYSAATDKLLSAVVKNTTSVNHPVLKRAKIILGDCYAYCNEDLMIWQKDEVVHTIGFKVGNTDLLEQVLVPSALSLYNK